MNRKHKGGHKDDKVTDKTEKQANRLVEKRRGNKSKLKNLTDRKKEGKVTVLGNIRRKLRTKRKDNLQDKINANPSAQKWRRDGQRSGSQRQTGGVVSGKKYQEGGEVDYNTALSTLGLIPALGKKGIDPKKKTLGKKLKKRKPGKNLKKQAGGTFNTGQGSFVEPGSEMI